jgi:hypothetical protein
VYVPRYTQRYTQATECKYHMMRCCLAHTSESDGNSKEDSSWLWPDIRRVNSTCRCTVALATFARMHLEAVPYHVLPIIETGRTITEAACSGVPNEHNDCDESSPQNGKLLPLGLADQCLSRHIDLVGL